ncbi:MAG: hypothetical protein JXB29_00100 [Sedimentisphaerales bacterium]|nr:hypothetical protein [Sedimentisphaerales bacterium]
MDMNCSPLSSSSILNEQVARQLFQILPEDGPIMVIRDRVGNCWPSDSEKFIQLKLSESVISDLCARIDDGHEPVVTQIQEHSIIATQFATEHTDCGHIILAFPQHTPESTLANGDLIEIVLNQINLILGLIEKNSRLMGRHNNHKKIMARELVHSC